MTVQNIPVINKWTGNGTNKEFDFDFRIDSASQLRVSLLSDYDTPLVLGTDYRIIDIDEGANYPLLEGGTIEYPLNTSSHDVLTSEDKIILELNIAFVQNTPFSQGGITASAIEECLDYNVRLMQRLKQDNDGFQEDIQTQVDNANTNASTALSKSTTALSNSNTAVSTANTASVNATNAVATANNASSVANIASTNATNAVNTANSASSTATAASNKVDEFAEDIETVIEAAEDIEQFHEAVNTCNQKATQATNAATNANTSATTASQKVTEITNLITDFNNQKGQINGIAPLDANAKLPIIHIPTGVELTSNKDVANGYCGLNNNSQIPSVNIPNITNCIIETPQNLIWEEIAGGVRLKAGSVVTFPDGFEDDNTTRKFKKVTTTQDIDITYTGSSTGNGLICLRSDLSNAYIMLLQNTSCGTTTPTGSNFWYDTTNNSIKRYNSSGILQNEDMSFPLGIFNFGTKKLVQSFDCYGFIGTGVFILDGIKYLIADGRNNDGSLKNKVVVTSTQMINCNSGAGYANNCSVSTMTTADILSYVYAGRLYFARTIDELPTITENSRNIAFVEKTNKWYHIYIGGGVNEWTETKYYAIPMCDFKYSSTGLYLESCSTPRVEKLVKSSDADGQWVMNKFVLANGVACPTTTDLSYSLSSILPNDACNYEVLLYGSVTTGTTSGNKARLKIFTDLYNYNLVGSNPITLCSCMTRTASSMETSGACSVVVGKGRNIDVSKYSSNTGTFDLVVYGYRRIGTNF